MNSYSCFKIRPVAEFCVIVSLTTVLTACARVSVTPESIRPPEPAAAMNAIEAEPTHPSLVEVRDFDFRVNDVIENRSPLHRAIDLVRRSSADERGTQSDARLPNPSRKRQRGNWTKPVFQRLASPETATFRRKGIFSWSPDTWLTSMKGIVSLA